MQTLRQPTAVHHLSSNGYTLSSSPNRLGALVPTPATSSIEKLREQFRAQGYLWLKNFFTRAEILAVRSRYFASLREAGLIVANSDPADGLYSGHKDNSGTARKLIMEFVRTAAYESFCFHPKLWQFYEAFLGGAVYLHKRKIVRHVVPGELNTSTGAHYDLTYLRGGTDTVCTSWIPLGDIPVQMGGLIYLEGSDRRGRALEAELTEQGKDLSLAERISAYNKNMTASGWISKDLPALADKFDTRWLWANYEAADMVVHSAYMIHASTDNVTDTGRIRLSTDIRYQRIRDEIDARWQNHWSLDDML
jgi:ectoine hydroxylase-related dioxygenase (phytanoyl-CoA dioxygenase family)